MPKLISDYRKLRRDMNLNQTDFWARVGATQSAGCRYELGRKPPIAIEALAYLAYVEKIDIDCRDFVKPKKAAGKAKASKKAVK